MQTITLKLQKNYDGEHRVAVYVNGKYSEPKTAYMPECFECIDTADAMRIFYLNKGFDVTMSPRISRKDWDA